jgi:SSS family solute:Na+ symporter
VSPVLFALLGYVLLQLALGVYISRRIRSEDDYLLAGRSLGPVLTTASIFATWFGAETCVGAAAEVYQGGLRLSLSDPFGYALCLFVFGAVLVVPLYKRRLTTLADLFRSRYSPGVEKLAALLLIPSSVFWASAQIRAFGRVIAWGTSLTSDTGIAIAALTACAYTAFGGLLADAYADLVQGGVLIVCLLILAISVLLDSGGLDHTWSLLAAAQQAGAQQSRSWLETSNAWAVPLLGSLFAQELLSRAVASESAQVARRSALLASLVYLLVGTLPLLLGAIARSTLPGADPEAVLSALSLHHLGSLGYVVLTGALVSAILSTVDSALLVAGSFVSHNLAPALFPGIDTRQRLRVARGSVVVLACVAYLLARGQGSVHELVAQASAFGSAGICVVGLMALFTDFGHARSAYAALTLGCLSWLLAEFVLHSPAAFLLSLGVSTLAYLATALLPARAA